MLFLHSLGFWFIGLAKSRSGEHPLCWRGCELLDNLLEHLFLSVVPETNGLYKTAAGMHEVVLTFIA